MARVWVINCGSCGLAVSADVVAGWLPNAPTTAVELEWAKEHTLWLRCPQCSEGSVKLASGEVYPTAPTGRSFQQGVLPNDVAGAWREARMAHAVAAYTAAEIMCRKILMHIAVERVGSKGGKTFVTYIDDLESANYLAPGTKPVIDLIRDRGNKANHELPSSSEDESRQTMAITEYLLTAVYELPGLVV